MNLRPALLGAASVLLSSTQAFGQAESDAPPPPVPPPVEEPAPPTTGQPPAQPRTANQPAQPASTPPAGAAQPSSGQPEQAPPAQAGGTTTVAPPPVEDPAQGTAPANEPAQPIGPPSELPYYQPAPSELLPPPPAAPAPPPKPQKPTPKFEFAPYFRSHYMLNDADFTYYEVGGQFLFGGSGTGVTLSYVSGIEGLLVGYQSPIFFGIPLYEGPVLLALTGPQAWAQFGIGDPGASLSVQTDPSAHFNFGGNPIGLEVAGCQGIPWFVQVGPQLSGMISFLPGGLDPLTWGTLGVDAKLGIMVF